MVVFLLSNFHTAVANAASSTNLAAATFDAATIDSSTNLAATATDTASIDSSANVPATTFVVHEGTSPVVVQNPFKSVHVIHAEKLDINSPLDRFIAFLEDPRVDLFVGAIACSFALWEILGDLSKLSGHHGVFIVTFLHSIKAFTSVLKESKRALKGYTARFAHH